MSPATLEGVWAKLRRAEEHLEALQAEVRTYEEREPHSVTREREPNEGWQIAYFHLHVEPPLRLGLILGDFFYNLRSALDHLAWQLVLLDGGKPGDHTAFPIVADPGRWATAGGGALKGVSKAHFDAIEALQPYPGRNDPRNSAVGVVNDHSKRDKHKTLHPTFAVLDPDPSALIIRREPLVAVNVDVRYTGAGKPLEDEMEFARLRVAGPEPQTEMRMVVEFPIGIAFGEAGLGMKYLPRIATLIESVIEQFAPDFERPP